MESTSSESLRGLILSDDLMDASKVVATARSMGIAVKQVRSWQALCPKPLEPSAQILFLDLQFPGLELAELMQIIRSEAGNRPRVIAYGSHVDAARLRMARELGCDGVMPRSQFFEQIPKLLRPDEPPQPLS